MRDNCDYTAFRMRPKRADFSCSDHSRPAAILYRIGIERELPARQFLMQIIDTMKASGGAAPIRFPTESKARLDSTAFLEVRAETRCDADQTLSNDSRV